MPDEIITKLLDRLDEARRAFGSRPHFKTRRILTQLARRKFKNAESLIRFHEALLFIRAYPQSTGLVKLTEQNLSSFADRVGALAQADTSALAHPEFSGIAGTSVTDTFSYYIVRWLLQGHRAQVAFDWDWFEDENRLAATWPRFLPLLEEDALVEANVPYRQWLREAKGRRRGEVQWLIERFESLPITEKEKAELYDSLKLYVRWTPAYRATRTGMRLPARKIFYHRQPLIRRKDVALGAELQAPQPTSKKLSRAEGEKLLNLARETSTLRYRELYGFTHGDPARVLKASLGRGVDLYIMGLPRERRLPLRAYHAAMIFKNGVPVGYFEGLSLFERMESGFNFYYTFREGETAWIYARTLSVFKQLLSVTAFSIDPYQIGYENEEGIESGAFWFYRKLGFRPTRSELLKLTIAEEKRIATRKGYRTSARTLRRLAEGYMIFELSQTHSGEWDGFQVRKLGLAVQRRMARDFDGDAEKLRQQSTQEVTRALDLRLSDWRPSELRALRELTLVFALIPELSGWSADEKRDLIRLIQAKAGADESKYLRSMQRHHRLRAEMIRLGSGNA
jgi:hypothetical protein